MIVVVFFVYAGWPAPDVNEAHYLSKAKHYWDPSWCAGDFFLESSDAHSVFYWSFGWLTLFFSLPTVAWIGRLVTWTLLAFGWYRLLRTIMPQRGAALLSAAISVCLIHRCHMAGEWLIGGVEAKGFAYVCVLFGLTTLVRQQWGLSWLWFGAASAFHILVGGWSLLALEVAWLLTGQPRPPLRQMVPCMAGALLLASLSLIPALLLSSGNDAYITQSANWIYVFQRLPHHLLFNHILYKLDPQFWFVGRFALVIASWLLLWWTTRTDPKQSLLQRFVAGAAILWLAGIVVDQATLYQPHLAAALLRYYWFRLADVVIPLGVSIAGLIWLGSLYRQRPTVAASLLCLTIVAVTTSLVFHHVTRAEDFRPASEIQQRPLAFQDQLPPEDVFAAWVHTCDWIDTNTPASSLFLTPRYQQTFSWYANRPEVVNWKNVPQDARSLVQWRARFRQVYSHQARRHGFAGIPLHELQAICQDYGVDYVVLDRTLSRQPLPWQRVYPPRLESGAIFEVYSVPATPTSD